MQPRIMVVLDSRRLGLNSGGLAELDAAVTRFPREQIVNRIIGVSNALASDVDSGFRNVNRSFAAAAPRAIGERLADGLKRGDIFLEPLQQLILLRRVLAVESREELDLTSDEGLTTYFDVCRYATDVAHQEIAVPHDGDVVDQWVAIAAGTGMRLWLLDPLNPNHAIARMRVILNSLPSAEPKLQGAADALKQRFKDALGVPYEDVQTFMALLSYWALSNKWEDIFRNKVSLRFDPGALFAQTTLSPKTIEALLGRIARAVSESLEALGSQQTSLLALKDRPLLKFGDGTVAPASRELLLEKLTSDVFWWVKTPEALQKRPWKEDWGVLGEAYVCDVLSMMAKAGGLEYKRGVVWQAGELDAAMWSKGHVALVEVTSSTLRDDIVCSGNPDEYRAGLRGAFVESTRAGKPPYHEAVRQLGRDVRRLLDGTLSELIPCGPIKRIYPVLVSLDRTLRTPGSWHFLQKELEADLGDLARHCSALVPLAMVDLEMAEQFLHDRANDWRGTPAGFLRLCRRWDIDRGVAPSWWQFFKYVAPQTSAPRRLVAEAAAWRKEVEAVFR